MINAKSAWDIAPMTTTEGTHTGTVIRIREMEFSDGCQILVRLDGQAAEPPQDVPAWMSMELYRRIHQEEEAAKGAEVVGIYFQKWGYDHSDPGQSEIKAMLIHLRPGHRITFRIGKSQKRKGKKIYCQYLENNSTGERSGYAS